MEQKGCIKSWGAGREVPHPWYLCIERNMAQNPAPPHSRSEEAPWYPSSFQGFPNEPWIL